MSVSEIITTRWPGRIPNFGIRDMHVGEMRFFAGATSAKIHHAAARLNGKYRARKCIWQGVPGCMVWRLS